jgi:membrane protein implicated in regulation of membrane protease activity
MPIFVRYWLFQLPELLAIGAVGGLLVWAEWIALEWVWLAMAADVAKDAALYPWLRAGYSSEPSRYVGPERLLGLRAVVCERLAPSGYVRIGGELWRAQCAGGQNLAAGSAVRVRAVEGLCLWVEPDEVEPPASADSSVPARPSR